MDELSILRSGMEILQQQNADLAVSLQHYKTEYSKLEKENINLLKENIKCKLQVSKLRKSIDDLKINLSRNINEIIKSAGKMRQVIDVVDDQQIEVWTNKLSPLPFRSSFQISTSNINHVHPMIQGVTIKKPVIRISRASLNTISSNTPTQTSVDDDSTNVIQASMEETSPNVVNMTDDEDLPQGSQNTDSPTRLLDLSVSLNRLDSISPRRNLNLETYVEHNTSQLGNIIEDNSAGSQGTESSSQNSGYSDDHEGSANIISGEPYDYRSRLECILEESENQGVNWVNSRKKLNPFVILDNTVDYNKSSPTIVKISSKNVNPVQNDDPMEGTSWRFNEEHVNVRSKKSVPNNVIENDNSMEGNQIPDSTTCVTLSRDSNQEQDHSFVKTFPSVLEFQSTPVSMAETNQNENQTPPLANKSLARQRQSQSTKEAKIILSKIPNDGRISNKNKKTKGKLKRDNKISLESETTPKKRNKKKKSDSCNINNSSSLFQSSMDNSKVESISSRPRRGDLKNYREKPLNNKLRRSK